MRKRTSSGALRAIATLLCFTASAARPSPPSEGPSLDPHEIAKFTTPLLVPPPMPRDEGGGVDYRIAVAEVEQQVLPPPYPRTPVFAYGAADRPGALEDGGSFVSPALVEATAGMPLRVQWVNGLVDPKTGKFLRHLFAVDPTLIWANPTGRCEGGREGTDCHGRGRGAYEGPVPIVPHLHGGHNGAESDGYPTAWFLPDARNLPPTYARRGSGFAQAAGEPLVDGEAVFAYPNDQAPATLWFHDHALGITRLNVYAGMAGFYLLRGEALTDTRTGAVATLPASPWELPLAIQDRSFDADGRLFYPRSRAFFDGFHGPTSPASDVAPIWNPEFFGNAIVVNGRTWPYVDVEPRRYRLRLLNGCDSRFLLLAAHPDGGAPALTFWQIGGDGGLLPAPVERTRILLAPGERADVILDLSGLAPGARVTLVNLGPDEPFGAGEPDVDFTPADPDTTGQVLQLRVGPLTSEDATTPAAALAGAPPPALGEAVATRRLSLNERDSSVLCVGPQGQTVPCRSEPGETRFGPTEAQLGILDEAGFPVAIDWDHEVTERIALGATEDWEFHNFTADAHPIHLHLVQFEVLGRQPLALGEDGMPLVPARPEGEARGPEPGETGRKDTVVAHPGEVTRVRARFDVAGTYLWHCHILEHEDNEMMRPYVVQ